MNDGECDGIPRQMHPWICAARIFRLWSRYDPVEYRHKMICRVCARGFPCLLDGAAQCRHALPRAAMVHGRRNSFLLGQRKKAPFISEVVEIRLGSPHSEPSVQSERPVCFSSRTLVYPRNNWGYFQGKSCVGLRVTHKSQLALAHYLSSPGPGRCPQQTVVGTM